MSSQYPGGFITDDPPTPQGDLETASAYGIWTISQAAEYTELGLWPTQGNTGPYPAQWPSSSPITFGSQVSTGNSPQSGTDSYVCGQDTYGAWYLNVQRTTATQTYVFYVNSDNTISGLGYLPSVSSYFGGSAPNSFAACWDSLRNRYIICEYGGTVKVIYSSGALTTSTTSGVSFTGSTTLLGGTTGNWDICVHDRTTDVYVIGTRAGDWYTVDPSTLGTISSATGVTFNGSTTYGLSRDYATGRWIGTNRSDANYYVSNSDILSSTGSLQNLSQTWDARTGPWTISGQAVDNAIVAWNGSMYYMNNAGSTSNPHLNYYAPRTA